MPQSDSTDFFRQPLAEMIDLRHPLAVLASRLPWAQIEAALAPHFARQVREGRAVAQDDLFGPSLQVAGAGAAAAGRPRLPLRLMASLLYLKHAYKLSDEELVERWAENVVWQHFSGMTFYEPRLPCDATQIGRFRSCLGEAGVEELLKATIDTAVASKAIKPAEFERLIVDTTVQEKAIAHPVDSRLLEIARHKVVAAAKRAGITLKQTFVREGKTLRRKAGGYAHAKQFKRLRKVLKRQRTILGIVLREVGRKIEQASQSQMSGMTAGIAGVGEIAGPVGQLNLNISPGYGFAAIIVAYLGRLHAFGIVLAGFLMALIYLGGEAAQVALQMPYAITGVFQGMLLFFLLGSDVFIDNRIRRLA